MRDISRQWLHSGDTVAEPDEGTRELPCAGAEVEDVEGASPMSQRTAVFGVAGPGALVGVGDGAKDAARPRRSRSADSPPHRPDASSQPRRGGTLDGVGMVDDRRRVGRREQPGSAMSRAGTSASSGTYRRT